jgi:hypothetical protein
MIALYTILLITATFPTTTTLVYPGACTVFLPLMLLNHCFSSSTIYSLLEPKEPLTYFMVFNYIIKYAIYLDVLPTYKSC